MQWAELGTARTSDLAAPIACHSSGAAWQGISLSEVRGPAIGELNEGYFLNHTFVLSTSPRPTTERRLASSRWRGVTSSPMVLEFIPAGMPFALRWRQPTDAIAVDIAPDFVGKVLGPKAIHEGRLQFWSGAEDTLVTRTVVALAEDVRAGMPTGSVYGECLGAALVALLARKALGTGERVAHVRGLSPQILKMILEFIDSGLERDLSLQHLAGMAGLSLDGFIRAFKQSMGLPPHRYVLRMRVERAQALLGNFALSMAEIALRAGFADQSHFSRMFHRLTGLAPRQYRKALR